MSWTFDAEVAANFEVTAQQQIPNYDLVITRCLELAREAFGDKPEAKIIDVGSARGRTVARLIAAGFANTIGVESSPHMAAASAHPDRIIQAANFPTQLAPFDMVLANWTLHFIQARAEYIRDIYNSLKPEGLFVLSERTLGSPLSYRRYLNFKRQNGVSDAAIAAKEKALQGVLEPKPLTWYLATLQQIGFVDIEVIDAAWCFNTILCRRPAS